MDKIVLFFMIVLLSLYGCSERKLVFKQSADVFSSAEMAVSRDVKPLLFLKPGTTVVVLSEIYQKDALIYLIKYKDPSTGEEKEGYVLFKGSLFETKP